MILENRGEQKHISEMRYLDRRDQFEGLYVTFSNQHRIGRSLGNRSASFGGGIGGILPWLY